MVSRSSADKQMWSRPPCHTALGAHFAGGNNNPPFNLLPVHTYSSRARVCVCVCVTNMYSDLQFKMMLDALVNDGGKWLIMWYKRTVQTVCNHNYNNLIGVFQFAIATDIRETVFLFQCLSFSIINVSTFNAVCFNGIKLLFKKADLDS